MAISAPDLTQRAPRSPRVRLGGYAILPRVIDKCRASLIGKNGEYNFNCPLDQGFFDFVGVDADLFSKELSKGVGDHDILVWVNKNAKNKHRPEQIAAWSTFRDNAAPSSVEMRAYFHDLHSKVAPHREDISGWFEILDVDDFVSFGGKA